MANLKKSKSRKYKKNDFIDPTKIDKSKKKHRLKQITSRIIAPSRNSCLREAIENSKQYTRYLCSSKDQKNCLLKQSHKKCKSKIGNHLYIDDCNMNKICKTLDKN